MKKVRGQHFVTLTYRDDDKNTEPNITTVKNDVKRLLAYIQWLVNRNKDWSVKINVYFSCVERDSDRKWTVKARPHAHLIVDSIPGSTLMDAIKYWWNKRCGYVNIKDIRPTRKDFDNCLNYCTDQSKASNIIGCVWKRVIGYALPKLKLESFQNPTDPGPVGVDATITPRNLIDTPLDTIDSILVSLYLIYQLNLISTNSIDSHAILNFLYPARDNINRAINNLTDDLSDGMVDSDPIMSLIYSHDVEGVDMNHITATSLPTYLPEGVTASSIAVSMDELEAILDSLTIDDVDVVPLSNVDELNHEPTSPILYNDDIAGLTNNCSQLLLQSQREGLFTAKSKHGLSLQLKPLFVVSVGSHTFRKNNNNSISISLRQRRKNNKLNKSSRFNARCPSKLQSKGTNNIELSEHGLHNGQLNINPYWDIFGNLDLCTMMSSA